MEQKEMRDSETRQTGFRVLFLFISQENAPYEIWEPASC